jgi:hypothetical protein
MEPHALGVLHRTRIYGNVVLLKNVVPVLAVLIMKTMTFIQVFLRLLLSILINCLICILLYVG